MDSDLVSHTLLPRADANSTPSSYKAVGIILAVASGLFIGTSFVLKKHGLLKANQKYNEEAGEGYGYLKNAWWWLGMTLMIVGELCNFAAYAFVDAILVTPFGALSVVVTTILSAIFLKERLSFVGMIGCFQCIIGAVIIALNAPEQQAASNIQEMQHFVIAPGFLTYTGIVIIGCTFVAFWVGPRYGKKNMFVYLTICSLIGGLSVSATQGLGAAIVTQARGVPQFNQWFLYVLFVFVVCTLVTEIIFLNKALNIFNAALVTPTYYVYFTSATIVTSAILFRGFKGSVVSIITVVVGFLVICSGVVLLQLSKASKDVPDTAVFSGDLDQVRTIAEQEEKESEPRADTIRGGAAIVRALSKRRTARQAEEVKHLHDEIMQPIREDEIVEWDGLRRRKTVLTPGQPSIRRTKTIHPPLGHSVASFPDDDTSTINTQEDDVHPGFFPFGRRSTRKTARTASTTSNSQNPVHLSNLADRKGSAGSRHRERPHIYGLPAGLRKEVDGSNDDMDEDTSYHRDISGATSYGGEHVHFSPSVDHRPNSRGSSNPPRPPPHVSGREAKRQFSFHNIFRPKSSASTEELPPHVLRAPNLLHHPHNRADDYSYSSAKAASGVSEEERLGLVKGDSRTPLPAYTEEPEEYRDDSDWHITSPPVASSSGRDSESPIEVTKADVERLRHKDSLDSDDDEREALYSRPVAGNSVI
ncbi:hypothetical protein MBLNU457_7440t1 [Dothideomycetes sp. NU457]